MDYEEELEEQYSAINKYQTKMQMENNDYYEPKIKTIRNDENGITLKATMPLITKEEMTTIDNNLQDIVNEFIQKVVKDKDLALSQYIVKKQNAEKQQLIKFLEDKIKERMDTIKINKVEHIEEIDSALTRRLAELTAYQEVLNFVNKSDKDE